MIVPVASQSGTRERCVRNCILMPTLPPQVNDNLGHLGGDTCHLGGDTDSQDRQDVGKACQGRLDYLRVEAEA